MPKGPLPTITYEPVTQEKVATMRAMIVGQFNTGKTSLAAGATLHPDMSPAVVLDVDRRLTTLASTENLLRVELPTVAHADRLARDISSTRNNWPSAIRQARTFILDSITLMRDKTLQEFASERAGGQVGQHTGIEFLYEERDYGYASNVVANLVDKLVQTGNHVIILAHSKETWNEKQDAITNIQPALNRRLNNLVGGMMHSIWYTKRSKPDEFRLLVLERIPYRVKITHPVFKERLREFTREQVQIPASATPKEKQALLELRAAAEGWIAVPYVTDQLPNTLPMLWDMYKEAVKND